MARRVTQTAGFCLRRLRYQPSIPQRSCAIAVQNFSTTSRKNATTATAPKPAGVQVPVDFAPTTKPPSARPTETRKSQMIRTYTSMLRTTPLILFFQHSNITAEEWAAVKRELKKALEAVPATTSLPGSAPVNISPHVKLEVVRTNMLNVALKIVEFHDPEAAAAKSTTARTSRGPIVHDLSEAAYEAINRDVPEDSAYAQIQPLMVGPLATLTIPAVSPAHLAAALTVLAPVPGKFPAPRKKKNPGFHDPTCQNGLAKLLLVGGRIEGQIFDQSGVNWVGGIEGGLDGLRAQLVHVLQSAGLGLSTALEGHSKSLWLTLESRKTQLEEESGEKKTE
ncbi:unnamed protein product [Clonostachys solani]|uniref:Ribosomal protein YmL11, mitochondrial n=1 Tax=Clonostachys solani TaxID=160281 RepID=A0A9N9ZEX3_9HYPO|nr:unnamed protein product [Clonostachys solani]